MARQNARRPPVSAACDSAIASSAIQAIVSCEAPVRAAARTPLCPTRPTRPRGEPPPRGRVGRALLITDKQ